MKKKPLVVFIVLAAALAAAAPAQDNRASAAGVWEVSFETPMGARTYMAAIIQDQDVLKVTMKSSSGTEMKGEGKIKGAEVSWSVVISGPMGEIVLAFKGKLEGEAMAGTVTMGEAGEADFKAKRTSK
jgi:hypothetical protein